VPRNRRGAAAFARCEREGAAGDMSRRLAQMTDARK